MPQILLVNPFSSAKYVSNRFREYNVTTVALYTTDLAKQPAYIRPNSDLFDLQIKFQSDNIADIITSLGERKFDYVINGFEGSVELSDNLAKYFTPQYANNPQNYLLRSDKYQMHKTLAQKNLPHIQQILYDTHDILPEIEKYSLNYPCFVKPLVSAASIGANKISNLPELQNYFKNTDNHKNFCQLSNNEHKYLISEYVNGLELFVDTFSINGHHHVSTIQRYHKNLLNGRPLYYYVEMEYDVMVQELVNEYITETLDALEFNNGFAHTEMFLLSDNTLKLIEVNPRVSGAGGVINKMSLLSSGTDQISLLMKYVFNHKLPHGDNKYSRCLMLYNLSTKPLRNLQNNLKQYSSVYEVLQLVPDGQITKSLDNITLADSVAFVMLRSNDLTAIEKDTDNIFTKDKLGWE